MGKIGMGELILILIIAIVVLGPDKLPQLARSLGKGIRSVKRYIHETTKDLEDLQELKDIQKDVTDIQKDLKLMGQGLEHSLESEVKKVEKEIETAESEITAAVEKEPEDIPAQTSPAAPAEETPAQAETLENNTQEETENG